jgi:rubrerythrin
MADTGPTPYWEPVGVSASGWEYAEAHARDAIRTNAVYLSDEAIAARALQRKLLREGIREALAEAKERAKKVEAAKRAKEAAQREARREWNARYEERARKEREQQSAWEEETTRRRIEDKARSERNRILGSKWVCTVCNGASLIKQDGVGYRITCTNCTKTAWGSHASLLGVLSK